MASVDSSLADKCMDFCHALTSQNKSFTFSLTIGSNFTFSLDTKENKSPAAKAVRKKSPSAIQRNVGRRAEFLARRSETQDIIDVTLATKDGIQDDAHQVVLSSSEAPSTTALPASSQPPSSGNSTQASTTPTSSSPPTIATTVSSTTTSLSPSATSTSDTTPSSPSDWKVVNSKQRPYRVSPAPFEKLDYIQFKSREWPYALVYQCKRDLKPCKMGASMYCRLHWKYLHMMKFHINQHHGIGPNPND